MLGDPALVRPRQVWEGAQVRPRPEPGIEAVVAFVYFDTPENERHRPTLEALECLLDTTGVQHRIVVVDNGSTDPRSALHVEQLVELYDGLDFIRIPVNGGTAYGVNTAWHYRRHLIREGAFPIKYDSDIVIGAGWLDDMVQVLRENPQIGLLGPRNPNQDYQMAGWQGPHHGSWFETTFVYGAVVARSWAAWKALGYMRNPYGLYAWDDHFDAWRAKYADLRLGVMEHHAWRQVSPKGCLPDDQKFLREGQQAMISLAHQIETGRRGIYEPFSGYEPDS